MSIRFAAVGFDHGHIYGQVKTLVEAGAELVAVYDTEPRHLEPVLAQQPDVKQASSIEEILEDESIQLITSAAIPCDRAPLGIRAMQHGKDYLADKPAFTTLEQLAEARRVQAETGKMYIVSFSERVTQRATVKAGELVHSGAIGQVVQTIGFGPHRLLGHIERPPWTFERQYFGGVINDLASHQVDQFLYFTNSTAAEVVSSQVGNFKHKQFPLMDDFGDLTLRSDHATGYIRVDWLIPPGLDTWGDVRLFILGTEGYIELRKNIDIAGKDGGDHLFLVDQKGTHYIDCANVEISFGKQLIADVLNRTETAMPQAHAFLASELALKAEKMAARLTPVMA